MQQQTKSPEMAAVLSFLINGLGQIYNGQVGKGILIFVVQLINFALTTIFIGFVTGPIVFIWSVYDAYAVAKRLNTQIKEEALSNSRPCPKCAERVQLAAKICRYCGYEFEKALRV